MSIDVVFYRNYETNTSDTMSVNEGLQRLRAIRRGHRAAATKSINEINGILSTTLSSESSTKLNALKLKLEWKQRTLNELDA
jgi:hypothetical protein